MSRLIFDDTKYSNTSNGTITTKPHLSYFAFLAIKPADFTSDPSTKYGNAINAVSRNSGLLNTGNFRKYHATNANNIISA